MLDLVKLPVLLRKCINMKIRKGDKIKVIAGKDKGREGIVEKVYIRQETVLVPGTNLYKKHVRKSEQMPKGGVVEVPRPLSMGKVMVICPKCKKPTRVGYMREKGSKSRICKKCKSTI